MICRLILLLILLPVLFKAHEAWHVKLSIASLNQSLVLLELRFARFVLPHWLSIHVSNPNFRDSAIAVYPYALVRSQMSVL